MRKTILKLSLASVLLIVLQACNFPKAGTPKTKVLLTQTSQAGVPITGGGSTTPTSPTQGLPSTPAPVRVRVSVATNCRTGPGEAYPEVSGFQVGQVANVVGRSKDKLYWIIQDPNQRGQLCWLWGRFAAVTGHTDVLPVFTAPPPPPPTLFPPLPVAPSTSSPMPASTP